MTLVLPPTIEPAWGSQRNLALPTRGSLDAQVARLLQWELFSWQQHVANVAGEYNPQTKIPRFRTVGVSVARQNGKTTFICVRIARQLIGRRQTVAYTAQDRGLARTKWEEHVDLLMDTPFADRVERVDRTNHREMLVMQNGSRYMPVTPSQRKAGRSLSIDLAIIDEAHAHEDMGVISGIAPAMAAKLYAQIWLLSNAGTDKSKLWKHYTDLGRLEAGNPASSMAWFEWAPHPAIDEQVANYLEWIANIDQLDRAAWLQANPSAGLPGGIILDALADGALTMDRDTFFREHLNIWMNAALLLGLDAVTWAACRRDDITPLHELCFSLDFTPERDRGALVVAGSHAFDDGDSVTPVEIVEAGSDLEKLISRAAEVANRWDAHIIIDRGSPAASAVPALEKATLDDYTMQNKVRLIPFTEYVRACGDFYDAAIHARVSHRGDFRLSDAVTAATKRKVGDAWAWQRRGDSDISPLTAATMARWGVVTAPEELEAMVW